MRLITICAALFLSAVLPPGSGAAQGGRLNQDPPPAVDWSRGVDEERVIRLGRTIPYALAFSPDGMRLAVGSSITAVRVFDLYPGGNVYPLDGLTSDVYAVEYSPYGTLIAGGDTSGLVMVWRASDGRPLKLLGTEGAGTVYDLAFSPDGSLLAAGFAGSGGPAGLARAWTVPDGRVVASFTNDSAAIAAVSFSQGGSLLACGSEDGYVRIYQLAGERLLSSLDVGESSAWSLCFSPDGRYLATGCSDGELRLYAVPGFSPAGEVKAHSDSVTETVFTPDCRYIVTSSFDGTARILRMPDLAEAALLKGHRGMVVALAVSGDGARIATGGWDNTIRLWRPAE